MKLCVLCLFPVNYKEKKTIEKCACEQVYPEIEVPSKSMEGRLAGIGSRMVMDTIFKRISSCL